MSLVGDDGGEEEPWHVRSEECSVTHVPSGDGRGEEDLCHVCSGGHSRPGVKYMEPSTSTSTLPYSKYKY